MRKRETTFIAIGGGGQTEETIEALFAPLEDVSQPSVVIMTVASNDSEGMTEKYNTMFRKRGVRHVYIVNITSREDAFGAGSLKKIEKADLIYFTGGDQLNVTSMFGGSPLHDLLCQRAKDGVTIAGTSAGAAMMSSSMIISGSSDSPPKKSAVDIAPGLDLIKASFIDTHFSQRGRHGRLLTAVAHHPHILGIGLDERTAIVVKGNEFKVIGEGSVAILDGGGMTHTDLVYRSDHEPVGMFDIRMHVLAPGYKFDLAKREPWAPAFSRKAGSGPK